MRLAWESRLGEQYGSKIRQKQKKNSNYAFYTVSKMHSLNLNCATQREQLKNYSENSLGEFPGRVMRRNSVLKEQCK